MTKRINAIASSVSSMEDNIKRIRESQKLLRSKKAAVLAMIKRTQGKRLVSLNTAAWVSISNDYSDERKANETVITIGINVSSLPGFKDKAFVELLGKFMDADKEETREYAASVNRDYFFWFRQPEAHTWIKVSVYAYVRSDSPTCRKVLTRVDREVIDKPVYEIVCD